MTELKALAARLRDLKSQFESGEIDRVTFDRERRRLLSELPLPDPHRAMGAAQAPRTVPADDSICVPRAAARDVPAEASADGGARPHPTGWPWVLLALALLGVVVLVWSRAWHRPDAAPRTASSAPTEAADVPSAGSRPDPASSSGVEARHDTAVRDASLESAEAPAVEDASAAVRKLVDDWIVTLEGRDLEAHLDCYAPLLARYFTKADVTLEDVRRDKAHFLARYAHVHRLTVTNVRVVVTSDGAAQALFDKDWDVGTDSGLRYSGSEQQQLDLRRIDGAWKIIAERELQIYWTRRQSL